MKTRTRCLFFNLERVLLIVPAHLLRLDAQHAQVFIITTIICGELHQQKETSLISLIPPYSFLKPLILGVRKE
jgi:hypothetical protein